MLKDDELWRLVMEDAKHQKMPPQMRELFITLMVFSDVSDPAALLEEYWESMAEDYDYQIETISESNSELKRWMLLIDLKDRLESSGNGPLFHRIGEITAEMELAVATARRQYNLYGECREVREELEYDKDQMAQDLQKALNGEGHLQKGKFSGYVCKWCDMSECVQYS